jgi:hypothetical protein
VQFFHKCDDIEDFFTGNWYSIGTNVASRADTFNGGTTMQLMAEKIGPLHGAGGGPLYRRLEEALREALRDQGLNPGAAVYRFNRIRYADDIAMTLEYSTIPGFGLDGIDTVGSSLYAALQETGNRPVRALRPSIERRGFLADGRVIEATQSWYRGDADDFVAARDTRA